MTENAAANTSLRLWSGRLLQRLILLFVTGFIVHVAGSADARTFTVAVVQDGPSTEDELVSRIEAELGQFANVQRPLRLKRAAAFDAGWDPARVRRAIQAALNDPEVEVILGVGSLVTYEAARPDMKLSKPFVSTFVQRADVLKLPYSQDGQSLKKNFSFIVAPQRAEQDLKQFRELIRFSRLHVAVTAEDVEYAGGALPERLQELSRELGFQIVSVPVTDDVTGSISSFGSDVQAVYLTRLAGLSLDARSSLIGGLTDRRIPTFSMLGHSDVERGAFAGVASDSGEQVVRRVAFNLDRLSRGEATGELPVILSIGTRLMINARTAQAVGYSPSPAIWAQATILHREALQGTGETLTYADALESAVSSNTTLAVQDSAVEAARQTVGIARSPLLPQVFSQISYVTADEPVAPLQGVVPRDAAFLGILVSQSLYNDKLWTLFRNSLSAAQIAELERNSVRLTVLESAGTGFMGLEMARSLQRIRSSNVELTESFLELARLRVDIGITGREDVLLWQSVLAREKSSLFHASQRVQIAQTALNQIMGVEQKRSWTTRDLSGEWRTFFAITQHVLPALEDLTAVERFREVATVIAIKNSPEVAALGEAIEAQELRLRTAKRSFWLPTFSANFNYLNDMTGNTSNLPGLDDDFWTFAATVRYPLFRGGGRFGEKGKAQADVDRLERQHRLAREKVELKTRIVIESAEGIYPRIGFTRLAADTAGEYLEIVRDQYGEGAKTITDLLSAQNNAFVAEQLNTTAAYEFLTEMVRLQRALGWFEYDKTAEEREQMFLEFEARSTPPVSAEMTR